MPRVPIVPIPDLAVAFVESVAEGRYPVRDMAERFNLTHEQASKRSWKLRRSGWLPPGMYTEPGWLELAQAMVDERLDALMEREIRQRAQLAKRLRRARSSLDREQRALNRLPAQMRLPKAPVPAPVQQPVQQPVPDKPVHGRPARPESVLDLFG